MTLSEICVRRPVFATMLVSACVAFGALSFGDLGVDQYPDVEVPVVTIQTTLRGASPEEIETQVTKVIEDAVSTAENAVKTGSVFADNGSGSDSDPDGPPLAVSAVNGQAASVATQITLASGALLMVNSDGTYAYDPNSSLIGIVDGIGTTTLTYDALDREVGKRDPYGRVLLNLYDPVGNRLAVTYPSGNQVNYLYNANNWLITMSTGATTLTIVIGAKAVAVSYGMSGYRLGFDT